MTFIKDIETTFAGMSLILRQDTEIINPVSLESWLSDTQFAPVWIPLHIDDGITKIMPVLLDYGLYPQLMESICQRIIGKRIILDWQNNSYQLTGVEVDSNALHVILISISATAPLPATLGRAIHAQCFQWFANANPILAENLHQQNSLPMTVGIQYSSRQRMQLRITLLKQELLAPLLWGLSSNLGDEITLAGISCKLGKWINIYQSSSFEKLAEISSQNTIELQFFSPTSFKQNQNIQPFPLPDLVFNSLLRRWNKFAPAELQFPQVEWQGLVSAFELKTHALKMEAGAEIGTVGWVKYRFPDPEQARIATILANFAVFSGVGRKTAMGMGQTAFINQ
ncbi:CRISPR system precrRNA processing endoribonuclease RAMP protein Cas6 [Anabaena cylindrica UHCC 0172]|uniref:CRISPR system precrRNA processing endoribonuclease RAMP protein Cas6 n=1 Tax=Anabaena cylindrica TaxID=1165 RepID=UPI002B1F1F9D|nr:CRISPR system precrRNA processing endoribonuclease RAMP protein Cas6 [Anabaena cylindrica]MEA5554326.1 CRISPR system precrRNA processing endoribonuclease RAMP protein Cas6 [Anabaena cylindrica UHCC 0172]